MVPVPFPRLFLSTISARKAVKRVLGSSWGSATCRPPPHDAALPAGGRHLHCASKTLSPFKLVQSHQLKSVKLLVIRHILMYFRCDLFTKEPRKIGGKKDMAATPPRRFSAHRSDSTRDEDIIFRGNDFHYSLHLFRNAAEPTGEARESQKQVVL